MDASSESGAALEPLRRWDYLCLTLFALLLFCATLIPDRVLSGHSSVLPQNSREMLVDRDWLVPKLGGTPWLERPPLPDWFICTIYTIAGRSDDARVARFAAVLAALPIVLLCAGLAGRWFGRDIGMLSGLILATMQEFNAYASNPEADIFLCTIVTAALAWFARLEFGAPQPTPQETVGFFGGRSWSVLGFFVLLGLTNWAKGLIFGTLMVAIPVAGFLLGTVDAHRIRRYVWLWGWLVFLAISLAWPVWIYTRYPEMGDFWYAHYLGRLSHGYMREPVWYYAVAVPVNLLPWTPLAMAGLWLTRRTARAAAGSPERFLWCWGILTPLVFSIPDGKHHHYMLHSMLPWAVLTALGAARLWRRGLRLPALWRHPVWPTLLVAGLSYVGILLLGHRLRGPEWVPAALVTAMAVVTFSISWFLGCSSGRVAAGGLVATLGAVFAVVAWYQTTYANGYHDDLQFLRAARRLVPPDRPLLVRRDHHELETFWVLYYSDAGARVFVEPRDLVALAGPAREVYVLARRNDAPDLAAAASVDLLLESRRTKGELSPEERRALFRLSLREPAPRQAGEVRSTPASFLKPAAN